MGGFELRWIGRAIIFLVMIPRIIGWGKDGHYAICKIAENYFTEDALAAVKSLLPDHAEGDLAAVCSWADEVRHKSHYRWSSPLHYVDTPDFRCNYQYCRDCHDSAGRKDRCVTGAIYNYTMQLESEHRESNLSVINYNLTEALMFLSHFVGDVHQPLHVGFTGDGGGNTITVRWYRRKTNLHHVWDNMIIESALKTFYNSDLTEMIQSIQRNITDGLVDISSWENCNGTVCPDMKCCPMEGEEDLPLIEEGVEEVIITILAQHGNKKLIAENLTFNKGKDKEEMMDNISKNHSLYHKFMDYTIKYREQLIKIEEDIPSPFEQIARRIQMRE